MGVRLCTGFGPWFGYSYPVRESSSQSAPFVGLGLLASSGFTPGRSDHDSRFSEGVLS